MKVFNDKGFKHATMGNSGGNAVEPHGPRLYLITTFFSNAKNT